MRIWGHTIQNRKKRLLVDDAAQRIVKKRQSAKGGSVEGYMTQITFSLRHFGPLLLRCHPL